MYTMKTSAISSRYLARGSFDGSLNLTCFPRSPRIVLHGSAPLPPPPPKQIPRDLVIVAAMKSHARRGNGARPRDPRSPRRFSCGGFVTELLLSLSLSLLLPLFPSPYFFAPTTRPRFERNVHEQVHAIYRAFLLPPSLASRRAILFNFVEAARVVKRLQRVNVVSLS